MQRSIFQEIQTIGRGHWLSHAWLVSHNFGTLWSQWEINSPKQERELMPSGSASLTAAPTAVAPRVTSVP